MKKLNVEDSLNILDAVYKNVVQGVPKVSKPVEVLALDYVQKYKDKDTAIKKLLKNRQKTQNQNVCRGNGVVPAPRPVLRQEEELP